MDYASISLTSFLLNPLERVLDFQVSDIFEPRLHEGQICGDNASFSSFRYSELNMNLLTHQNNVRALQKGFLKAWLLFAMSYFLDQLDRYALISYKRDLRRAKRSSWKSFSGYIEESGETARLRKMLTRNQFLVEQGKSGVCRWQPDLLGGGEVVCQFLSTLQV